MRDDSPLIGGTLEKMGLGAVVGLNVYAVQRGRETLADMDSGLIVQGGDMLFIHGSIEEFRHFLKWCAFEMARGAEISELLALQKIAFLDLSVGSDSMLVGMTVARCLNMDEAYRAIEWQSVFLIACMIPMGTAMAAFASFISPISHPANVMVKGPGGYRFIDYLKMGVLLAILVMFTVLPVIAFLQW